jgi:hypothetical protein
VSHPGWDEAYIEVVRARMERKTNRNGPIVRPELGNCWLWTGATSGNGYGSIRIKNVGYSTHAVAFFLEYGRFIEMPLETRHQCDVRACVRPSHLLEGTRSENARDCRDRGRDKSRREANSRRRGKLSPHGAKTRCPYGHEYAPGNLYFNKNGGRACRTCALQRAKAQKAARKAKRATCSGT